MDIINKINSYTQSVNKNQNDIEYNQFKNTLFDYNISEKVISIKPYFITQQKREEFLKITETLLSLFEKLTCAYFNNNEIRHILSVQGRAKDYMEVNPGYSLKQVVTRFDAFYNISNGGLKFLEVNLDNPSYIGMNDLFINLFNQLPSLKYLRKEFIINSDFLIDSLYKVLIKKYKEYCSNFKKKERKNPHIVIVCSRNSFIKDDVDLIVKFLKDKDLNVNHADPRDFVYDGKVLKLYGENVDIVYRDTLKDFFRTESTGKIHSAVRNKILTWTKNACLHNNFINSCLKKGYFGHAEDIIKAYSENNVCIINPFSSGVAAQKITFALVQDDRFKTLFNDDELDAISKYIPWTRVFGEYKTSFYNKEIDLANFVKTNKKEFVLKPNRGYGGKGIIIGPDTEQKIWERKINGIIRSGLKYVVQEFIDIPTENFPALDNSVPGRYSKQYFNINFWGIDGKYAGAFIRASEKKIINITQGGKLVPLYYIVN